MSEDKLKFQTLALRREHASENHELSPVTAPSIVSYGSEDHTRGELWLALTELPDETRPATVARLLLPDGVQLDHVDVELVRTDREGRLARPLSVRVAIAIVPEPRVDAPPAGYWVFVPVLEHACFVDRKEDLKKRLAAEIAVLPSALALDFDGWRRLATWTPTTLEEMQVELATTPLAQAKGRKALAEAERKRLAVATLDAAGRRVPPQDPPQPLVGRDELAAQLARALEKAAPRRSVLLVGDEAAGKSALVHAWVAANAQRDIWATSASELVAGASGLGEWQQRVAAVLEAAETLDAVLYFDDFGALFADRPAEGGIELGAALRAHVVDGRVRIVGELTAVALDRAERRDVSLIGSMLRIQVAPTDPIATIAACEAWARYWQKTQPQRPQIALPTVRTAVDLARRYLPYRAFPGKAVRLLEELRVAHDAGRDEKGTGPVLGDSALYSAFSWATGIPIALLDDTQALSVEQVLEQLRRRMVGQDEAVRRVAEAICVAKARLQPADKPLASLLFVGPSGVGKTELARSVAAYLFGAPDKMVRLDMSEYTDPWAAERLFGSGNEEGRLTSAVKSQPFGVVLLDEIEKAHPSVFDLLLQVLGEARLTDGRGRTTYFHNSIIVLTSNLGTRGAKGRLGLGAPDTDRERDARRFREAVLGAFRPELVNRLDQIVVFHPLAPAEIAKVAEIAIARLGDRRGFAQPGVILDVSPAATARLAEGGFSPDLGARALRRYLDAELLGPAARLLAKAGSDGAGGTLTVRAPDEVVDRPEGSRLGEHKGDIALALWRRAASTGRKLVRGALSLGELRRQTDRELAMPAAQAVRDRLSQLEATLATSARKKDGQNDKAGRAAGLPGKELARMSAEHARISAVLEICVRTQGELRAAEELCLEALARDIDAVDLIDTAVLQREQFRRDLFFLLTALRPQRSGATLMVHSPDARAAVVEWLRIVSGAATALGWHAQVHIFGEQAPGWDKAWGPPHDRAWIDGELGNVAPQSALVRIAGTGADVLFALERGLHRFAGLAGEPCHVWVQPLEPKATFTDLEWAQIPGPPQPMQPIGKPVREIDVKGDTVTVSEEEIEVPYKQLAARLPEASVVIVIDALQHAGHKCRFDRGDQLWAWDNPLGVKK